MTFIGPSISKVPHCVIRRAVDVSAARAHEPARRNSGLEQNQKLAWKLAAQEMEVQSLPPRILTGGADPHHPARWMALPAFLKVCHLAWHRQRARSSRFTAWRPENVRRD